MHKGIVAREPFIPIPVLQNLEKRNDRTRLVFQIPNAKSLKRSLFCDQWLNCVYKCLKRNANATNPPRVFTSIFDQSEIGRIIFIIQRIGNVCSSQRGGVDKLRTRHTKQ